MADQETQEAPAETQSDFLGESARKALEDAGFGGAPKKAAPEPVDEHPEADAEGSDEAPVEEVSAQDKYLRKHLPQAALKKMTLAERFEAYHELREREIRTLGGQKGRERKDDSPSGEPDTPRESTAARSTPSDAALSEALTALDAFSKENALDGFTPILSKPLQALSAENAALKQELSGLGAAVQSLLRDRAVEGVRAKYPQLEGSVREEFEQELEGQLKTVKEPGIKGLQMAAEKAARIVMGTPAASPSSNVQAKKKRTGQPTAPTGRSTAESSSGKSMEDIARESIAKHLPHLS